ncbi:AAA family ATPase [Staphylococcus chromogenes]|uniref:AAA family ATPase n=1 Tax=Staphylococcus chromogenes TaxID=46126 RepID=UPI000CD225B8|nr:AAA family ATPase [Staphylococcus chromogenes]MBP0046438.1 AAA family ATPase [Staphylococcus chromogenes]PNY90430.1 hypothetical protein CD151_10475 [Staphylococcus chromogenes]GGI32722.1 hypothetical protein GCM10008139_15780 [Staphylococcus chromogenes]SUM11423.1 recombination protein F [Staphylococcus chromogenes]
MLLNDILDWVEELSYWQKVIAEKILKNEIFTYEDVEKVFEIVMVENKLSDKNIIEEELKFKNIQEVNEGIKNNSIKWKGLENVVGVNAIHENAKLGIGPQLTIIYGENGSGKTGYTRLLNNIFISKGDKKILQNIFDDKYSEPSAVTLFEYENEEIESINYPDVKKHPFYKKVAVFDSHSATEGLTNESELSFTPFEFDFFDKFLEAIELVKKRFDEEVKKHQLNDSFKKQFMKETSVKKLIENIDSYSNLEHFKESILITDNDKERREKNYRKLLNLKAQDPSEQIKTYKDLIKQFREIKKYLSSINGMFNKTTFACLENLVNNTESLRRLSSEEGVERFKDYNIKNIGSQEWENFLEAAFNYYNTIEHEVENCLLCRQNIQHTNILNEYWEYLKSGYRSLVNLEEQKIKEKIDLYSNIDGVLIREDTVLYNWISKNDLNFLEYIKEFSESLIDLKEKIIESLKKGTWNIYEGNELNFDCKLIDNQIEKLNNYIDSLNEFDIKKEIRALEKEEDEFSDKSLANNLISEIEEYYLTQNWLEKAKKVKINTTKITRKQNELFSKYVTQKYIDIFEEECIKLNANFSTEISQRGKKGTTFKKLLIKGEKPVNILSEGEQRAISLANFLAESSLSEDNICIILDDPVSSLDNKRKETIANRLINECFTRQVVIFTHDLLFLKIMVDKANLNNINCEQVTLRRIKNKTGISTDDHGWITLSVKKRISKLKDDYQKLQTTYKNLSDDRPEDLINYENQIKLWFEKIRETWEKSVEDVLFNGAVRRFDYAIQTQRLDKAAVNQEYVLEITKRMTESSKWVHDKAEIIGEEIPEPEVLKEQLDKLDAFYKKLVNNQKK